MTHYYDAQGNPKYEILGKNGKYRVPYVKEAKELGLVPGVTSIISLLGNEAINAWNTATVIELCKNNPFCSMGSSEDKWLSDIKNKLKYEKERITNQGKDIHNALDKYYKTGKIVEKYKEFILPVIELIERQWPMLTRTDWIPEKCFNYKGLYGGSVDLHTEAEGGIILDYKTKDSDDLSKYKAYESHKQQLIAYAYGLNIPNDRCGNIFLSAHTPNILTLEIHEDLKENWEKFKLLVKYWHLEKYNELVEI